MPVGHERVDADAFQGVVDEAYRESGVPGIAAGVVTRSGTLTATAGVGTIEMGKPVTSATLFQVGSISKTFAATLAMLLVQDGSITLDDPVARHLPDLNRAAPGLCLEQTTVRHLLTHSSGFDGDHLLTAREGHDLRVLADARRLFPPGAGYSYSNAGFSLLGAVIEAVTGTTLETLMRRSILEPLDMTGAAYRADDVVTYDVAAPHWVVGDAAYVLRRAGWQTGWELGPLDHAPGGLIASVDHLLTWARFHLASTGDRSRGVADGATFLAESALPPESRERLHQPVIDGNGGVSIAMDWFVQDIGGVSCLGHGGVTVGYVADLFVVPTADLGIVVLTNATNGATPARRIRRWALEAFAGLTETDPAPVPGASPDVSWVLGRYDHAFGWLDVTAGTGRGEITISTTPHEDRTWQPPADAPITCAFVDPNTIVGVGEGTHPVGTFGGESGGRAGWLNWHERRAPRIA